MKRLLILSFIITLLLNLDACGPKEPATPAKQCRLTSVTERYNYSGSNRTYTTEYRYDAAGNLVQLVNKNLETNSNGSASSSSSDIALTYDGEGYLKKLTSQSSSGSSGNESMSNQNWEYEYTNRRLSKTVCSYRYTSSNGTQTTLYEYDQAGKPLKVTMEQRASNENYKQIHTFANGVLRGVVTQYEGYPASSNNIEYNAAGFRVRYDDSYYGNRWTYDTKNRLVREEISLDGKLRTYFDYEYDDRPSAYTALPKLKGHPEGPNFYSFSQLSIYPPNLRTIGVDFEYPKIRNRRSGRSDRTGQFFLTNDMVGTPVYGTNGLPEMITITQTINSENSQGQIVTTRSSSEVRFTYENCPN